MAYYELILLRPQLNSDNRIRATLLLCSWRRADDARIQNAYPQKKNWRDEAGQAIAIVGIPINIYHYLVLFFIEENKICVDISVSILVLQNSQL